MTWALAHHDFDDERATVRADRWLPDVSFCLDSHEHVVRDYQGSYYYRPR
jgi:hypothetical protein